MGEIDGWTSMDKHWIFFKPAERCVLTSGHCVYVCKAYSLIDLVVSQCNRSFCYAVVCKMIDRRTGGWADGAGRQGEAGQGPPVKKLNIIH